MEQHRLPPARGQALSGGLCPTCGSQGSGETCPECLGAMLLHGRYRLLRQVGRGATGTVFQARDADGATVAIKELPLLRAEGPKARELLVREARVLQTIDHPRVPRCHDHFIAGQGRGRAFYLVQDFIDGETLADELARGTLDEAQVLAVLAELLAILVDLHGREPPVLHRDIKPANVMRATGDGRLVLLDFGAVRDVLRDSKLGGSTVAGTFGYMAPEQFQGDARPATDLYGLGALAVNLLTGRDPAKLHGWDGRFRWESQAPMSPGLAALLRGLLEPDPSRRLGSAVQALERVRALQAGKTRLADRLGGRTAPLIVAATAMAATLAAGMGASIALRATAPPATAPSVGESLVTPVAPATPVTPVAPVAPDDTVTSGTWSAEQRHLVLLGPEAVAVEFPLGVGGAMNQEGYLVYTASVGNHRFSLRLSGTGQHLPLEERVAQAELRVSANSDSQSPWETVTLDGAAQIIDDILILRAHDAELAALIAADPEVGDSRFSWSDSDNKRVTVKGTTVYERPLAERPWIGQPLSPRTPDPNLLEAPYANASCQSKLVVEPNGDVSAVRVTGCEIPYAIEVIHAQREWRFFPTESQSPELIPTRIGFDAGGSARLGPGD